MGKRGHNEGSLSKRGGKWRAQITINGRRLSATKDTKREALDWLEQMKLRVAQGMTYDGSRTSFGEYMDAWLRLREKDLRPKTIRLYRDVARLHINPILGEVKLRDLDQARIQRLYDKLLENGVGVRTVRLCHSVIHTCLKAAEKNGLIFRNWAQLTTPPKPGTRVVTPDMIWNESQITQFMISIRGHKNEYFYALAFQTGMRVSELIGLQWKDIHWDILTIWVRNQLQEKEGGGWFFQQPKTASDLRPVEVTEHTLELMRAQLRKVREMQAFAGKRWKENDFVFPNSVGNPQYRSNIYSEFIELTSKAGLKRIRFHDIRHTAASLMLLNREPPDVVAARLGHSSAIITQIIYSHFIPGYQRSAAELMDRLTTPIEVDLDEI